ncbi:MAG: DedA family protein [Deltaproteobacteria bacterium]
MEPVFQNLPALAPYIQTVNPYVMKYGYGAVFLGLLLEDFGLPVPGEGLLIAGALFASLGDFNIFLILFCALLGAVAGDNIGYAIGHFGGRKAAIRYGRFVFLTESRFRRLESFFDRHGGKIVAVARFFEGLRQFNGILAGTGNMAWRRFLLFNILGSVVWVGFWGGTAYFMGERLGLILTKFKRFEWYLLIGLGLLVVAFVVWKIAKNKHFRHDGPKSPSD